MANTGPGYTPAGPAALLSIASLGSHELGDAPIWSASAAT
ncbi:hypothetical protein PMNALOAF_2999 [Methylobacterium adhaesivum]|nr:hypothetical protein PMNALOAF_2999 [Methylobacterium adhaesivum]